MPEMDHVSGSGTFSITIEGKDYQIGEIKMGDLAAVSKYVRSEKLKLFLENTRHLHFPDGVRAKSIAEIVNASIDLLDLLQDHSAIIYLFWRIMSRYDQSVSHDWLLKTLNRKQFEEISNIVFEMSGLEGQSDPLSSSISTDRVSP